jgi:hypothetical protein
MHPYVKKWLRESMGKWIKINLVWILNNY